MKKFVLIAILATALAIFAAACAAPTPTAVPATAVPAATTAATTAAQPAGVKVLRIGRGTYPSVLDPQKASYGIEIEVLKLTYEGLLSIDNKGNIGPGGADKWTQSPDGTSMSFHIRDGLVRSDGTPIKCEDYKYALDREVDPMVPGKQYTSIMYDVKGAKDLDALAADHPTTIDKNKVADAFKNYGVECTDDQDLKVTFANPVGFWNYIAYTWVTYPTDKRAVDADPDNWWTKPEGHIGNGPFKIQSMEDGKKIVFVPNDKYWRGSPKLDRIELIYNVDSTVTYEAYKKDELDMDSNIDPQQVPDIVADDTLKSQFLRYPAAVTQAMANNNSKKPFDDKNVRIAFSQALDRAGFVRDVQKGIGVPYTRWIPPGVPGAQDTKTGVPDTDAKAAVQTLVNNGYAAASSTADKPKVDCDKLGEIKLTYGASPINNARFQFLAGNYINVFGCPVTLDPVDATVFTALTKDVKTNPQISRQGWIQDYPHPQDWLSLYWECGGFSARWGYCNKDLDAALSAADQTLDFETAIKKYQDAENILMGDVPGAFMNYSENIHLVKPWVVGPKDYPSSSDAEWAGEWGPVWTYDIDLTKVPSTYPTQ